MRLTPGNSRALRYNPISEEWSVLRLSQTPGQTQDGLRQDASISGLLQARRYILAVGPPRSEMVPVKPGTLSRISSISLMIDSWERLWIMRPSCSVIEQKVQPPKQPRMMFTEKRIMS